MCKHARLRPERNQCATLLDLWKIHNGRELDEFLIDGALSSGSLKRNSGPDDDPPKVDRCATRILITDL
jgi:hypothetical protein